SHQLERKQRRTAERPPRRPRWHRPCLYGGRSEDKMPETESVSQPGFVPRIGRSVSIDHAAELLRVSRRTIYNRIREGRLQTIRTIGGSQRVLIDSVNEIRRTTHN